MKYIYIVNGRADKELQYQELFEQIARIPHPHELYTTKGEGDATRFVRVYCDLHPDERVCFVACGGSGMVNEVASGIVGFSGKEMAILFFGGSTGDLLECFPGHDFRSVSAMLAGTVRPIDIVRVNDSYFVNVCNFGFDSKVAERANDLISKGMDPEKAYRRGIVKALLTGRFNRINVKVDGERIGRGLMLLCTLGNGRKVGGQFICSPNAKTDDGLIEVCYIRAISLLHFLLMMPVYSRGELVGSKLGRHIAIYRQAREVEITAKDLTNICLDGEILAGTRFEVRIMPKALPLRLPPATATN